MDLPGESTAGSGAVPAPSPARTPRTPRAADSAAAPPTPRGAAWWEGLRSRYGEVAPVDIVPGAPGWMVLGYRSALEVLRDGSRFTADPRAWDGPAGTRPPYWTGAIGADGEEHRRLRRPVAAGAARTSAAHIVPAVRRAAAALLDPLAAAGHADLVADYAAPLPSRVLADLFGLDGEHGALLAALAGRTGGAGAGADVAAFFGGLAERRRTEPGRDLASLVLENGAALTAGESAALLERMWRAGAGPAAGLIAAALDDLLHSGAPAAGLVETDALMEHALWAAPPVSVAAARFCRDPIRLAGVRMRPGQAILVAFDAVHADPRIGGGAAGDRSHLMWGAGAHGCPAQSMARELAGAAVQAVLDRFPELAPAEGRTGAGAVPEALPVLFPAEPPQDSGSPAAGGALRAVVRRVRRPRPVGARYGAPKRKAAEGTAGTAADAVGAAGAGEAGRNEAPAVRRAARRSPAGPPPGIGARYQAPAAQARRAPDALEALLERWRKDGP